MSCLSPIYIQKGYDDDKMQNNIFVDCRKCEPCKKKIRTEWSLRLQEEEKNAANSYFITLTYDDDNLPLEFDEETGELLCTPLRKEHISEWLKRMRARKERVKKYGGRDFIPEPSLLMPTRFFATGEYGDINGRPHYHILLFNYPKNKIIQHTKETWAKGRVHIGDVTPKSIHYVAKYCLKEENFALMSRGYTKRDKETGEIIEKYGGIGFQYADRIKDYHKDRDDYIVKIRTHKGEQVTYSMPKIWRKRVRAEHNENRKLELLEKMDLEYWTEIAKIMKRYNINEAEAEALFEDRKMKAAEKTNRQLKINKLD